MPVTPDGQVLFLKDGYLQHPHRFRALVDVRDSTCPICGQGWEENSDSLLNQRELERLGVTVHADCWSRHISMSDHLRFQAAMDRAGSYARLRPITGRYDKGRPWYQARWSKPSIRIVLGRRKRVDSLAFHAQGPGFDWWKSAKEHFSDEDVTKEFGPRVVLMHAWTDAKLEQYLRDLVGFAVPKAQEAGES